MLFAECDNRRSPIKNFTDTCQVNLHWQVNLRELQVDDISAKFTAESTKKYIPVM